MGKIVQRGIMPILLLAGGALLAIDIMSGGGDAPTTSVSVGDGSASVQLGWSW